MKTDQTAPILKHLIAYIEDYGLQCDAIYAASAAKASVDKLLSQLVADSTD